MDKKGSKKTNKTHIHWPTIVLIVSVVLLLIPTVTIGMMLLDAFEGLGSGQYGNRFVNERVHEIDTSQLKDIESQLLEMDGIERVSVNLKSATLRVNVDVEDEYNTQQVETVVENVIAKVFSILDKDKYFSEANGAKQYDFEVHAYNKISEEDDFIYYLANKNSMMEEVVIELVSDPKNPEFVQDLYDRLNSDEDDIDEEDLEQEQDEEEND